MNNSKWYESSTGSGLSMTIGGFSLIGIAQAINYLLNLIGHPVDQSLIEQILTGLVGLVGALFTLYGLIRKAYFAFASKSTS